MIAVMVGFGAVGLAGVFASPHLTGGGARTLAAPTTPAPAPPPTKLAAIKAPATPPDQASGTQAPSVSAGIAPGTVSSFPRQPITLPPPEMLSQWAQSLTIPNTAQPKPPTASAHKPTAAPTPAAPTPPARTATAPMPAAAPVSAAPTPAAPAPSAAPVSAGDTLPSGAPLRLQIVYTPVNPGEAAHIAAFADRLQRAMGDGASASEAQGPVSRGGVLYYFATDRSAARRVAASVFHLTSRQEPVTLAHATPLPPPGTVEIRLPLNVGKALNNEPS